MRTDFHPHWIPTLAAQKGRVEGGAPDRLLVLVFGRDMAGDVGVNAAGERVLSVEDVLDGVTDGALAAAMVGDDVGFVLDVLAGVGHGEGEAAVAHDRAGR